MNDATDVSLESDGLEQLFEAPVSDRIEQLLEAPVPPPPVVMIEYRSRGVPWWMLVSFLVIVPIVVTAITYYYQSMLERYRERASKLGYLLQAKAIDNAVAPESGAAVAAPAPAPTNTADAAFQVVGSVEPTPPASAKNGASALAPSSLAQVDEASKSAQFKAPDPTEPPAEPPAPRVRSISPGPLEAPTLTGKPSGKDGDSDGSVAASKEKAKPAEPANPALLAGKNAPRDGGLAMTSDANLNSVPLDATGAGSPKSATGKTAGEKVRPEFPKELAPLPTEEEERAQLAREAASKELELAGQAESRKRAARYVRETDRLKFHNELREILEARGKKAGEQIDALARRSGNDHDPKVFVRARNLWRDVRLSQAAKVTQIRALDIPEADILNFISDSLYGRMHSRGGPKDMNEVRTRAAKILLSFEPKIPNEVPDSGPIPSNDVNKHENGGARPQ